MTQKKPISLTGDRPTGPLHIGHYVGSLNQRIVMQEHYNSFIMIADAQAYTDHMHERVKVKNAILQVMEDYISVGLDINANTFFVQSCIPEIQELSFYLNNFVTVSRLERIPTIRKEIFEKFASPDKCLSDIPRDIPVGFLSYPVSQSADILIFQAEYIPVGRDQLPILELTNEIVKNFNNTTNSQLLKKCIPIFDKEKGTLPGLDGKAKMSKTLGNTINLNSTNDEIMTKVKTMYTDPKHIHISDPGIIEGNMVFTYLDYFYKDKDHLCELKEHYRKGGLGDSQTKKILTDVLIEFFEPIQIRRQQIDKEQLLIILKNHTERARNIAAHNLAIIKQRLGLNIF